MTLIGKRFRTLVVDGECDDDFGEVTHPIGSTFVVVGEANVSSGYYIVAWEQAIDANGKSVPAYGMWTLWTEDEILTQSEEVQ
jgi:hypothetical protein